MKQMKKLTALLLVLVLLVSCVPPTVLAAGEQTKTVVKLDSPLVGYIGIYSDPSCSEESCLGKTDMNTDENTDPANGFYYDSDWKCYINLEPGRYYIRTFSNGDFSKVRCQDFPVDIPEQPEGEDYYYLRFWSITFSIANANLGGTGILKDEKGNVLAWLRTTQVPEDKGGGENYWEYAMQAPAEALEYSFEFTPNDARYDVYTTRFKNSIYASTRTYESIRLKQREPVVFRVPNEYVELFHLYQKPKQQNVEVHYVPFQEIACYSSTTRDDGYTDLTYYTTATQVHYTIEHSDALGNIKLSRKYAVEDCTEPILVRGYSVNPEDYSSKGWDNDTWTHFELDNDLRLDLGMQYIEENLYLNVPDSNYLTPAVGDSTKLEAFRIWQAVDSYTTNYFIEPDFHYEVLQDEENPIVTLEEQGAEGRRSVKLTAQNEGLALIKVTYDAMYWSGVSGTHKEGDADDCNIGYYDALDPVNTRVVVVNAGAQNTANLKINIQQTEFDTIYFDENTADSAAYTFTPTADAGYAIQVRVHDPLHNTEWGEGWTDYTQADDGSFTVALKDGRNIIEVKAVQGEQESVEYYVVNCRAVDVQVTNLSRPGAEDFRQGDQIAISFDGLYLPQSKMAGIYNPNFPNEGWVEYVDEAGKVYRSRGAQYAAMDYHASDITITLTEAGELSLINGRIHASALGDDVGAHRNLDENGKKPNTSAGDASRPEPYFGELPDVHVTVQAVEGYEPPADSNMSSLDRVIALIDALEDPDKVTLDSYDAIDAVGTAMSAATRDGWTQEDIPNYANYKAVIAAYNALTKKPLPTGDDSVDVILTVSSMDGFYTAEETGTLFMAQELTVPYFDLGLYGLENYYYNPNCYGDNTPGIPNGDGLPGTPEQAEGKVTLMHLFIYATELYKMSMTPEEAGTGKDVAGLKELVSWTGNTGSAFMTMWEFGTSLNYYLNYEISQYNHFIGTTCDQILLSDGDRVNLHALEDTTKLGTDLSYLRLNRQRDQAEVAQGREVKLNLYHTTESTTMVITGYAAGNQEKIYYIPADEVVGEVQNWKLLGTTNGIGELDIAIDLEPGDYYLGVPPTFNGTTREYAPGMFQLTVTPCVDHEFEETTQAATCLTDGCTVHTCRFCGYSYQDAFVPATGHEIESQVIAPTHDTMGYTLTSCKNCDFSFVHSFVDPDGHSFTKTVTKEATCTTEGEWTFKCDCGESYTMPIPTTGHSCDRTVIEATCEAMGYTIYTCKHCEFSFISDLVPAIKCPSKAFTDVDTTLWYHEAVDYVVANKLMNGTSATTFEPMENTTRAMVATLLYRIAGEPDVSGLKNPFTDVTEKDWFCDAVVWAFNEGVVTGATATIFNPNDKITREQLAVMLWRYADKPEADEAVLKTFTDAASVGEYAKTAMAWAVETKLVNGLTATTLVPTGTANRAQIATILMRYTQN